MVCGELLRNGKKRPLPSDFDELGYQKPITSAAVIPSSTAESSR